MVSQPGRPQSEIACLTVVTLHASGLFLSIHLIELPFHFVRCLSVHDAPFLLKNAYVCTINLGQILLNSSERIVRVIKERWMELVEHVAQWGDQKCIQNFDLKT
jgi:hypothetical protein